MLSKWSPAGTSATEPGGTHPGHAAASCGHQSGCRLQPSTVACGSPPLMTAQQDLIVTQHNLELRLTSAVHAALSGSNLSAQRSIGPRSTFDVRRSTLGVGPWNKAWGDDGEANGRPGRRCIDLASAFHAQTRRGRIQQSSFDLRPTFPNKNPGKYHCCGDCGLRVMPSLPRPPTLGFSSAGGVVSLGG